MRQPLLSFLPIPWALSFLSLRREGKGRTRNKKRAPLSLDEFQPRPVPETRSAAPAPQRVAEGGGEGVSSVGAKLALAGVHAHGLSSTNTYIPVCRNEGGGISRPRRPRTVIVGAQFVRGRALRAKRDSEKRRPEEMQADWGWLMRLEGFRDESSRSTARPARRGYEE